MAELLLFIAAGALAAVAVTQQPPLVAETQAAPPNEFGDPAQLEKMLNRSLRHADGYFFLNNANVNTSMAAATRNPLLRAKGGPMHPLHAGRLATAYRQVDTFRQDAERSAISEQFITSRTNVAIPLMTTLQRTAINDEYPFSIALNRTSERPEQAVEPKYPYSQTHTNVPISWPLRIANVAGNIWRNGSTVVQGAARPVPSVGNNTPTKAMFADWSSAFGTPNVPPAASTPLGRKGILKR